MAGTSSQKVYKTQQFSSTAIKHVVKL